MDESALGARRRGGAVGADTTTRAGRRRRRRAGLLAACLALGGLQLAGAAPASAGRLTVNAGLEVSGPVVLAPGGSTTLWLTLEVINKTATNQALEIIAVGLVDVDRKGDQLPPGDGPGDDVLAQTPPGYKVTLEWGPGAAPPAKVIPVTVHCAAPPAPPTIGAENDSGETTAELVIGVLINTTKGGLSRSTPVVNISCV